MIGSATLARRSDKLQSTWRTRFQQPGRELESRLPLPRVVEAGDALESAEIEGENRAYPHSSVRVGVVEMSYLKDNMRSPLAGSIVITIRHDEFVLIASDSFSTRNYGRDDYHGSIVNKIELHPNLPMAVATAGLADLPILMDGDFEGQVEVRKVVRDLFSTCRYERHLKRENIEKDIRRLFLPQVQAVHNLESERPDLVGRGHLDIIVATYAERSTELIRFRLEEGVMILKDDGQLACSGVIEEYYRPRVRDPNLYGDQFASLPEIAAQLCRAVQEGIDFEAALKAENERECGGPINLAIVDSKGARFLDTPVENPFVNYHPDDPFFTTMHEAGHAVHAAKCGFPFTGVEVIPRRRDDGRTSAGRTHLEDLNPRDIVGKGELTLPRLIQCIAGPCAEELVNPHAFRQSAADDDRSQILQIARFAIAGRMENEQPQPILPEEIAANEPQIHTLISKAEAEGSQFAHRYEKAIRKVAAALQARTSLSSDEVRAFVDECRDAGEVP